MKKTVCSLIVVAFASAFLCGSAMAFDIRSGPIGNNVDAAKKCPGTCTYYSGWNGNWKTTVGGQMSVCGCNSRPTSNNPYDKNAGPIRNNVDAPRKCANACLWYGGWNGNWKTISPGQMSVCGCNEKD
ncbi:MAG TPA: mannan-binding lectin [Syntrophales bacterium]|nr:mannan-binding lectin [Syntrophales bacterium]